MCPHTDTTTAPSDEHKGWRHRSGDDGEVRLVCPTCVNKLLNQEHHNIRGTRENPCEYCGQSTQGSTRDYKGFMRCNVCGRPAP